MPNDARPSAEPVVLLPGIVLPAGPRYAPLLDALGDSAHAVPKDLEVYATDTPPDDYSVEHELDGIDRAADAAGFERFHLYAHSGGGACALAYAATRPQRLLSLAVDEPATDFSPEARKWFETIDATLAALPPEKRLPEFVKMQLAPGVEPPPKPAGPEPEWMRKRPAGIDAFTAATHRFEMPEKGLREFRRPVYYSYGSLSNPVWADMRDRLASQLPDFTAERYEGLHHFNTSHVAEPERVAAALAKLWRRA